MRLQHGVFLLVLLIVLLLPIQNHAGADWSIYRTLSLEAPPIDMAVSANGNLIYVLTDQGDILIYYSDGRLADQIKIGKHIDQIEAGPREELIVLRSKQNKAIQVLAFEIVKDINISGAPFKGNENAPVSVVVFSDFECGYCSKIRPLLDQVLDAYPEKVKIVFKNFPLKRHGFSRKAAMAALAAQKQGLFWEFHERLFENQKKLSDQKIDEIATVLGLDQQKFKKEMISPELMSKVQQDLLEGKKAGVRSVPTVFVNGRQLKNRSFKGFKALIDKAIPTPQNEN